MASLVKAICGLRDGRIAPIATWETLHPAILLDNSPFHVPATVTTWERGVAPRRVGLHSIGIGGVNAHVLLEQAPAQTSASSVPASGPQLVLLSARSPAALQAQCRQWREHILQLPQIGREGSLALAALARASRCNRDAMPCRAAYLAPDLATLAALLAMDPLQLERQPVAADARYAAANTAGIAHRDRRPALDASGMEPTAAASAWLAGRTVSWRDDQSMATASRAAVPLYPFDEKRYWLTEASHASQPEATAPPDPFAALFHETFMPAATGRAAVTLH